MQKRIKIFIFIFILCLLVISALLAFSLRGIFSQAKESLVQVQISDSYKNDVVEQVLQELKTAIDVDFSESGDTDFEWQYNEHGSIKSFNVVGRGYSIRNAYVDMLSLRNFFEYNDFYQDPENFVDGNMSGLYGYHKDEVVCLVSGVNSDFDPLEPEKELIGDHFDVEVQCGQLGEQDVLRLALTKDNSEKTKDDHEVKTITLAHIANLPQYIDCEITDFSVNDIVKMECPGCFETEVTFDVIHLGNEFSLKKESGKISLDDWVVVASDFFIENEEITRAMCEEQGGVILESEDCPEGKESRGQIIEVEENSLCCYEEA